MSSQRQDSGNGPKPPTHDMPSNLRSEAIDQMTELLQEDDWALPEGLGVEIVAALRDQLSDTNWCARLSRP